MTYLTQDEIDLLQLSNLSRDTPFLIAWVGHWQLSIARHYGGCKFNGQNYTYIPTTDELVRDDVLKWVTKRRKEQKRIDAKYCEQGSLKI
jgi:hypothetical protein